MEEGYKQILSLMRIRKGVDFTFYKQTTIEDGFYVVLPCG